ncbi:hypothetical protein SSS_10529 [Sarcoptes scabiei]|nr:hypothetical protein SSS_10529 [Sarcoptes scabiei]
MYDETWHWSVCPQKTLQRPHHRKCPKHSHWAPCGLSCPKTCAHPHGPLRCPLVCKPGCKCDKDYVRRNSDGTGPCVRRRHCKRPHHRKCPKHSHWAPCGLSCPKTCAHPHGPLKCPLSCRPGCKCDKDYVRRNSDGTGPCVRRRHCKRPHHRKCPKHSHWAPCGRSCPKTCARPHGPLNVHYHVDLDANAIKAMCDETAMAVVHVSVEDIARTITKKDRKKDRKNTTKKVTKKIDFENRLIFLGLIVE